MAVQGEPCISGGEIFQAVLNPGVEWRRQADCTCYRGPHTCVYNISAQLCSILEIRWFSPWRYHLRKSTVTDTLILGVQRHYTYSISG